MSGITPCKLMFLLTWLTTRYLLSLDNPAAHKDDWKLVNTALTGDEQLVSKAAQFYLTKTKEMIAERSFTLNNVPGRSIDIVVCPK